MNDLSFLVVPLPVEVKKEITLGNYEGAEKIIREIEKRDIHPILKLRLEYELERMRRMRKDYPWNRGDALKILGEKIKEFREEELDEWISEGIVDRAYVEGEERFYERFVENLFFLNPKIARRGIIKDDASKYARMIIDEAMGRILNGDLRKYKIVGGIKVKVKRKGNYRVWLPFPKENFQIERVRLIKTSHPKYYLAENDAAQRTIYLEGYEKEFFVEFEYTISEVKGGIEGYANIDKNKNEKLPHVVFTPYIRDLVWKIVDGCKDDYEKALKIYEWITKNTNYTYVREYCMYDNIGEYVATSLRGDCGMFALLFITLCRAVGIPAKWQSGWFITPKFASPHDWAQVYVNNTWLPVDASFGNFRRHGRKRNKFYFGNLDAFRMIANDDFMVEFTPEKNFWRSDPVDNQRGEIENKRRNIYFDEFTTEIFVKEFRRI
ncbi:transglutaminase-like domain-containing protein [Aciduliprofundum sp. MAR08-339]|uniref:transglutaminase domain-containing protein n=1 Tax=Aciduliprofundum sp. (strain MAR08-339) TaxID=673860 RepID=UPI00064F6A26